MKRFIKPSILAAVTAVLVWLPAQAQAQQGGGRGNFDPAEMRQRMMERYKTTLEITSDDEWKAIEPRIQKINEARRAVGFGGGMRGMGMMGPGAFGGRGRGGDQAGQGGQQRRRANAPEVSAATQELQKAIESKASADTIKAKLAAYRADRAAKQAALDKAQEDLKKVLTVRQEALAVVAGLLD